MTLIVEAFNAWALCEAYKTHDALLAQRLLRAAVEGVRTRMKDQLALNHIGLSRVRDRQAMANRCCGGVTVGDFGLKWPVER